MYQGSFTLFFQNEAMDFLLKAIHMALAEDGPDKTTNAVFPPQAALQACVIAKQDLVLAGLPIFPLVLEETAKVEPGEWFFEPLAVEGTHIASGTEIARMQGSARVLLRAERILLNFLTHLCGIATLVHSYVQALEGTGICLLDTRKTLPCLRYPEKYAVTVGGGRNHRKNLAELLMLKDNHIDAAGGVELAVACLRAAYSPCPPIEVECRTIAEVYQAVGCGVSRIMLDNMDTAGMAEALSLIPQSIEVELSGGVSLDTIPLLRSLQCRRKPDYISVGRLTHSAPAADLSMRVTLPG